MTTLWRWISVVGLVLVPVLTQAQPAAEPDFARLSLEDLMKVEIVSLSKREQAAGSVAAAVHVITRDDIRRSGITTLPDLFRLVPGVQVARVNASTWAVSVRGFNDIYSNKLLVLIDGRAIYNRAFSGVFWNTEDLFIDDIERIEIIRGPGASIWGANAVNGVINIVTRSANESQGLIVRGGGGTFDASRVGVRYGSRIGDARYRVHTQLSGYQDSQLGERSANDHWLGASGGFRLDWEDSRDAVSVAGSYAFSESRPLWLGTVGMPSIVDAVSDRGTGFVQGRWERSFEGGRSLTVQSFLNHRWMDDPLNDGRETVLDMDVDYRFATWTRHDLVLGGGVRSIDETNGGSYFISILPEGGVSRITNAFVQDEITVTNRVRVTLGSKFEHDTGSGLNVQPTARVSWELEPGRQHLWASIARAIRTPSTTEYGMTVRYATFPSPDGTQLVLGYVGNPAFESEKLVDVEAGYRAAVGGAFNLDVAAFRSRFKRLRSLEPRAPSVDVTTQPPTVFVATEVANLFNARTEGVEVAADWTPAVNWRVGGSYSFFHYTPLPDPSSLDLDKMLQDGNAPAHQWQLHSTVWLGRQVELNTGVFQVGRLEKLEVPSYLRVDARLEAKLVDDWSLVLAGQNLTDNRHIEFSSAATGTIATEVPRSGSIQFVWRLR